MVDVQRDMYMRASQQSVLAHDALHVGKDVIGLDCMTAAVQCQSLQEWVGGANGCHSSCEKLTLFLQ